MMGGVGCKWSMRLNKETASLTSTNLEYSREVEEGKQGSKEGKKGLKTETTNLVLENDISAHRITPKLQSREWN